MISRHLQVSTFVAGVLVIFLAGCGGGGGGSSPPSSPSTGSGQPGSSNEAPSIEGKPGSTAVPAQPYVFQPSAADPEASTLTFTATNLPAWMSINGSTGRIAGTPAAEDVGAYRDIVITVSDGRRSASLGPFTITVSEAAGGSATLSWTPPLQNTDGTPLLNLAGYEIRYGRDANDLSEVVSLDNPSLSIYVIENLSSGTWYFAVAAINSVGVESSLSELASKTIS